METREIAKWAFIAFGVIAILMGLIVGYMAYSATLHWVDTNVSNADGYVTLILLILGIVIGLISVGTKEVTPFLIASIALVVAGISGVSGVWQPLTNVHELLYYWAYTILKYIAVFAAPAAVIIAARAAYAIEKAK